MRKKVVIVLFVGDGTILLAFFFSWEDAVLVDERVGLVNLGRTFLLRFIDLVGPRVQGDEKRTQHSSRGPTLLIVNETRMSNRHIY